MRQRWYRVDKLTGCLPIPTAFSNRAWDNEDWQTGEVGEIDNPYRKFDRTPPPILMGLDHICGTPEQFLEGEIYPSPLPDTKYRPDGLPECCGAISDILYLGGFSQPQARDALVLGGSSWYCTDYTVFWGGALVTELPPFAAAPQPQLWRSVDAEVYLWAPNTWPFFVPYWRVYVANYPFFNTSYSAPASWDGHGCQVFQRLSGTDGPDEIEVCCG